MTQNIFQVTNETHLNNIIEDNPQKIILIMYSTKNCKPCKDFKPKFINMAKKNPNTLFIYVDNTKYNIESNKYFGKLESTPTFIFYFSGIELGVIVGANEGVITTTLSNFEQKIEERKKQIQMENQQIENNKFNNPDTEIVRKKMMMLNKLLELSNNGAKLTNSYNLDSKYEDILFEYRYQVDPEFRQHILNIEQQKLQQLQQQQQSQQLPQQIPPQIQQTMDNNDNNNIDHEHLKKQQKVTQIKELNKLHQKMQMQSYQKLEQLKKLQLMKEQAEKSTN